MNQSQHTSREKISFIIPCYNSTNTIGAVVEEIKTAMSSSLSNYSYEIILINDGSPDGTTFDAIETLVKSEKNIKGINLSRNFGQHAAIMAGLHYVDGDYVILGDDDGQTPFNETYKLIDKIKEGKDLVCAKYIGREKRENFRKLGTAFNEMSAQWLINKPKDFTFSSFAALRRFIADELISHTNPRPSIAGMELLVTRNVGNVDMIERNRIAGKTGYNLKKLASAWFNGFSAFSVKPLRIVTILGVIIAAASFIYGTIVIIRKILFPDILEGYSAIMTVMLFMFGLLFFFIGLLGEYVGRIYISQNNAPQFVVKEFIESDVTKINKPN